MGILPLQILLYNDGTVERFYDRNTYKLNLKEKTTVDDLSGSVKERLLENCPEEHRDQIQKLFYPSTVGGN